MQSSKELIEQTQGVRINSSENVEELTDYFLQQQEYKYLEKHLAKDIVSLYHDKSNTSLEVSEENQMWWYHLSGRFNRPLLYDLTENNEELNKMILPHYFQALDKILEYATDLNEQEKQEQGDGQGGSGEGEGDGKPKLDLNNLGGKNNKKQQQQQNKPSKESLEEFINQEIAKADKKVEEEMKNAPEEVLNAGKDAGDESGIVSTPEGLEALRTLQKKIKFNKEPINRFLNKTITKVKNTFRNPADSTNIEFLESDDFDDLADIENVFLDPLAYFINEITSKEQKYGTIVDIFLDFSGSIHSTPL